MDHVDDAQETTVVYRPSTTSRMAGHPVFDGMTLLAPGVT
jgi:hypothetical protein